MSLLTRAGALAVAALLPLLSPAPAHGQTIQEQEWHLDALGVPAAQQITDGEGVVVAVVDSGVDASHPDLIGQVLPGTGFGASAGSDGHTDTDGHGTAMAATIAGSGVAGGVLGIAPAAKILPVASSDADQFGLTVVADSIRWAVDNGAQVINLSLGFQSRATPALVTAVNHAVEHDVVLVASTGNESGEVSAPANIRGVLAVAGTTRAGEPWQESNTGHETVLAAPAETIVTAMPVSVYDTGYAEVAGTSSASAIVAGVAALVRARYPGMSAADVVNRLISTATDVQEPGRDDLTGFGVVDPVAALTADVPPVSRNPLLPPERITATGASSGAGGEPSQTPRASAPAVPSKVPFLVGTGLLAVGLGAGLLAVATARNRRTAVPAHPLPPPPLAAPPEPHWPPITGDEYDAYWRRPPGGSSGGA
ncbi:S8 family serine peptidase [Umezawaea beigongshangensis]|uniref:S8 family serine peptidase n=1 Tax=Umezawaea beigongshangensis TaxID=2780383 RepID=UPI0018F1BF4D|nr:S8 family serine peptidase [Umezawaea beigongshangensis]